MIIGFWFLVLLSACAAPVEPTPQLPPAPTVVPFTPFGGLPAQGQIITLGYLLVRESGALLVGSASFAAAQPQALGNPADAIWCGDPAMLHITGALSGSDPVRSAIVIARGTLSEPGAYGPSGIYRRQLRDAMLTVIVPEETSVANLQDNTGYYEGRVVRVNGGIVTRDTSAVLVDRLGSGGVPQPAARQVKLRWTADDTALLAQLNSAPGGKVRFGQVQIEGYWHNGTLIALAIRPVSP